MPIFSAFFTSLFTSTIAFPLDFMRVLFMNDPSLGKTENRSFRRIWDLYASVYRAKGIKGYFNGFGLFFVRSFIYCHLMWLSFEYLKQQFVEANVTKQRKD